MRCEEKVKGGKLVCIEIVPKDGKAAKVRITGDFFLHPEDSINALEQSLEGVDLTSGEDEIAARLKKALGQAQLIGASPEDLARIFKRASS
ncbi:MAG: lipoate protein ligase C-terminal domain-containing protein [Candidatus ainarchaeum sp.]|nr:lipoate protein ligase C-terminal domain-containing protein [Candidatus ainarchaeum sp.]